MQLINYSKIRRVFLLATVLLPPIVASGQAQAQKLFEGYYKVLMNGQPVGYAIQRTEFDVGQKVYRSVNFVYAKAGEKFTAENHIAVADAAFGPLSFTYSCTGSCPVATQVKGEKKKSEMPITIKGPTGTRNDKIVIDEKTFLATFIPYVVATQKFEVKRSYSFKAIEESSGQLSTGKVNITGQEKWQGIDAYRLEFQMDSGKTNLKFTSLYTGKAELLFLDNPDFQMQMELVRNFADANPTQLPAMTKVWKKLFGSDPKGQDNPLSRMKSPPPPKQ